MSKNTLDKPSKSNTLQRRPIHKETQHLDEDDESRDDLNDSPSKSEKLYTELTDKDEPDTNEEQPEKIQCKKSTPVSDNYLLYFKYIIIACIIAIACFFIALYVSRQFSPSIPATELSLKEKLKNVQDLFQDQNHLTFRILEKAIEKVVDNTKEPSAPAIFTVTVNKNAIYKAHEFSHYLANTLAPQNIVIINESVSQHRNPDNIKFKIDSNILSKAEEKRLFVVVVDNLQNIPLKGAMIFHSYCDHETAPFKQAVFLFIVPLNEILPENASSKRIDKSAFQQFKNIWNKASADEIDSLITRITVNVINIR